MTPDIWNYDNAPTDPNHGGKMTAEMAAKRIEDLERVVRDFLALERVAAPDMSGKKRGYAFMRSGPSLAAVLDAAEELVGRRP